MNNTIGKTKIAKEIAAQYIPSSGDYVTAGLCEKIIDAYNDAILTALLDNDRVVIKNFITYEVITRSERASKDLNTGEPIVYPPTKSIKCKVSKVLKDAINFKE